MGRHDSTFYNDVSILQRRNYYSIYCDQMLEYYLWDDIALLKMMYAFWNRVNIIQFIAIKYSRILYGMT